MSTGLMKAQGNEEVNFMTAWLCSPPDYRVTVVVSPFTSVAVTSNCL